MNNVNWKNATPEQLIMWNAVRALAWWVNPVTITPLYYQGVIAGSEFVTYAANKLYLCLSFNASAPATVGNSGSTIIFCDEANATNMYASNDGIAYDAGVPQISYKKNLMVINNIYFSRISATVYTYMRFIGYKITK